MNNQEIPAVALACVLPPSERGWHFLFLADVATSNSAGSYVLKRTYFLLTVVPFMSSIGNAQLFKSIAAKVAYSSAFQALKYSTGFSDLERNRINVLNAAISVDLFDGCPFALVLQCEYAQRGVNDRLAVISPSGSDIIGYVDKRGRVSYLSFPILAKVYLLKGVVSPYLLAGGRVDFMLGHKSDDDLFAPLYDGFAKSTYGFSGGAGAEYPLSREMMILVDVRYNSDLKDSFENQFLSIRNNSIDVWLGVAFNL